MKYKKRILLTLAIISSTSNPILCTNAITYMDNSEWGGRFGDKLIMYIKAKWVAHQYNVPFYYKPFSYSDQLMMHELETWHTPNLPRQFSQHTTLQYVSENFGTNLQQNNETLYTIHYYFMPPSWGNYQKKYDSQEVSMWIGAINNETFRNELRRVIKPRNALNVIQLPEDKISVAVHVRKGGGFDWPLLSPQQYNANNLDTQNTPPYETQEIYSDRAWPLKFVPDQFYIDQIKKISEMLDNTPIHVQIFTDDQNPQALLETYKAAVNKPNVSYGCRKEVNHHTKNVLQDLFSMAQCDCLIRAGSNFPQIAQLIGNHRIVLFPKSMKWLGKTMIVDEVGIINHN